MTKILTPLAGTIKENLERNETGIDLGYGDETGGVITFYTITEELYDEWWAANKGAYSDEYEFDLENVTEPGVYRDDEIYEDGSEKCFTVIVGTDFLCRGMIKHRVIKLNEKYDTDFKIPENEEKTVELQESHDRELA